MAAHDNGAYVTLMASGSRSWNDPDTIRRAFTNWEEAMALAAAFTGSPVPSDIRLIHGGAGGADRMAAVIATEIGWTPEAVLADWETHGKRAGILRNLAMLDRDPAHVFIFWDGLSRGTKHVIDETQRRTQSYEIHRLDEVSA